MQVNLGTYCCQMLNISCEYEKPKTDFESSFSKSGCFFFMLELYSLSGSHQVCVFCVQRLVLTLRRSPTRTWSSRCGIWEDRQASGGFICLCSVDVACALVDKRQTNYWLISYEEYFLSDITWVIEAPQAALRIFFSKVFVFFLCVFFLFFFLTRPYWRCYYSNTDAIIYVVDSSDRDRMSISKSELVAMLEVRGFVFICLLQKIHLKMVKAIAFTLDLKHFF